jgi:cytochrome P450
MAENGQIASKGDSVAVEDLPLIPELADRDFPSKLPSFVDDIFFREYQGLMRGVDGSVVAYRNCDLKALMVKSEVTNMTAAEMTQPVEGKAGVEVPGWERIANASIFTMLPPLHAPARQLLSRPLARGRIAEYQALAEEVVREISRAVAGTRTLDYQHDYARRIAARFWRRMIGLTPDEEQALQRCADGIAPAFKVDFSAAEAKGAERAAGEYMDVLSSAILRETQRGQNELLNGMTLDFDQIENPDKPVSASDTIASNLFDSLHTIAVGMANVAYALLSHPDAKEQLDADHGLIGDVVQEGLRFHSPVAFTQRLTRGEVVQDDVMIPPGTPVTMAWSVGNRDPETFADPNTFRLGRTSKGKMTFGGGFHICPGRNISVLMIEAALRVWCVDELQISLAEQPKWGPTSSFGQLESIPVSISLRD